MLSSRRSPKRFVRALSCLAIASSLAISSCKRPEPEPEPIDVTVTDPVTSEDPEIQSAMEDARQSFDTFLTKAEDLSGDGTAYMARVRVLEDSTAEDVLVSNIIRGESNFTGIVGDLPVNLREVTMGDEVIFSLDQVVEWQYFGDGKVVGAQVARVKRSRMDETARAEFDLAYPFPFE